MDYLWILVVVAGFVVGYVLGRKFKKPLDQEPVGSLFVNMSGAADTPDFLLGLSQESDVDTIKKQKYVVLTVEPINRISQK